MTSLTEHTIINGLEENLKNAIEDVGGVIPENICVWKYPDVIKEQLTAGKINITPGDGIDITIDDEGNYVISCEPITSENITVDTIDAPQWSGISKWEEGTFLQKLIEDLVYEVIPKIPSVTHGDVIFTNENGEDEHAPEIDSYISPLDPNEPYLRLFLASQKVPIYISLKNLVNDIDVDLDDYYTKKEIDEQWENYALTIEEIEEIINEDLDSDGSIG